MKLADVYAKIDGAYPKKLSDEYVAAFGGHDNSGILIDTGADITGAVFSLDLSEGAIACAKAHGANLIVTHHPAIFFPVSRLSVEDPVGARLIACVQGGISVVSMHLNLDCAPEGIDMWLAKGIGCKTNVAPLECTDGGGYGRIYEIEPCSFAAFGERLKREFSATRLLTYGKEGEIGRVASFCGAGVDAAAVAAAKRCGADVIVSSDVKHNFICDILESGMRLAVLTHYAGENYGFKKIYQSLCGKLGVPAAYYEDGFML